MRGRETSAISLLVAYAVLAAGHSSSEMGKVSKLECGQSACPSLRLLGREGRHCTDSRVGAGQPQGVPTLLRLKGGSSQTTWKACVDTASGKTYYYNRETKVTSWKLPEGVTLGGEAGAAGAGVAASPAKPAASVASTPSMPQNPWRQCVDAASGRTVRFHATCPVD